jgi:hypothetical protein
MNTSSSIERPISNNNNCTTQRPFHYCEYVRLELCPVGKRTCAFEMREFQYCIFWRILYYVVGHYPSSCLYLKKPSCLFSKHNISETGFYLRLQVKPTQLGPIDRANPYLRRETESSLWNVVFWTINRTVFLHKDRMMDNVQQHNICNVAVCLNYA